MASSLLTIIQDGMDQAKLRVPRWGYKRISKAMEKVFRPALHLVGTYTHGYKLQLSLADEDQKKNSETSIELVCTALCSVLQSVGTVPLMVHLQQDTTYREGKNTFMLTFMMLLQVLCCVRITTLGFLRTAHSHDDIDQCFGQISRLLMGKTCSSADGMISILQDCIMSNAPNENSASGRIRGSVAEASKLDEVSLWKDFVGQVGIKFKGLRHIHYFRFCHRRDLGPEVLDNVLNLEEFGRGFEPNPTDTFLVTKRWLADHTVLRAICVVPESMAKDIRTGFTLPRGTAPRRSISEKVRKNLQVQVPKCHRKGELSDEAAQYLLQWSSGTLARVPKPTSYPILNHRFNPDLRSEIHQNGRWERPRRLRHYDLTPEGDCASDDSSESEGVLDLPVGFED